jgi:hypothetical protein
MFFNFKMKTKFFRFKILQRMHRKFPAILQQNHQNSILFHETIPLKQYAAAYQKTSGEG